jgi:DNA polymerase III subunit delta
MAKDSQLEFERLSNVIKSKEFSPVYLLQGDEPYFIDKVTELLEEHVLPPEEKSFNQTVMYGKDTNVKEIIFASKRYPMMSTYQLIIVKEAQSLKKDSMEDFLSYVSNPLKSTILVLCYKEKKLDQRTKLAKAFAQHTIFNSEKIYDNKIPGFVERYIRHKGKTIDPPAAQLISEFIGSDLSRITSEIDKMLINLAPEIQLISISHVEENIGVSKDFNVFELQKALGENNFNKSIQIANHFASNPQKNPLLLITANLSGFFNKLLMVHEFAQSDNRELASKIGVHEFFLTDYKLVARNFPVARIEHVIGLLNQYDLKMKGYGNNSASESQLIIEMVVRILSK